MHVSIPFPNWVLADSSSQVTVEQLRGKWESFRLKTVSVGTLKAPHCQTVIPSQQGWKGEVRPRGSVDWTRNCSTYNLKRSCSGWGCSLVGRASGRHAADAGSIPRCGKGFFSQSQLSVQTLYDVRTPPCAIAYLCICAHVKDPIVHVSVRWIMETLK